MTAAWPSSTPTRWRCCGASRRARPASTASRCAPHAARAPDAGGEARALRVFALAVDAETGVAYTGGADNATAVHCAVGGGRLGTLREHTDTVLCLGVARHQGTAWLLSGGADGLLLSYTLSEAPPPPPPPACLPEAACEEVAEEPPPPEPPEPPEEEEQAAPEVPEEEVPALVAEEEADGADAAAEEPPEVEEEAMDGAAAEEEPRRPRHRKSRQPPLNVARKSTATQLAYVKPRSPRVAT
eukprot:Transcript_28613.p2 GENE.Transcript_28613~~Transcript_28613.p2  ORF type:complete len:242 (+),score=74.78 Transcript_28613:389-1114(+)